MLKVEYQRQLLPMLRYLTTKPLDDPQHINISDNVLRSLKSEVTTFASEWIRQNEVTVTSRSKYSFVAAERMAAHHYFKLLKKIRSFKRNTDCKVYGYLLTLNPRKLQYNEVSALNRLTVRMLKRNANVALIQKEVENTYYTFYRASNNIHIHYLVFSTQPLNRKNIVRSAKRYGKRTSSVTDVNIESVDNDKKAASYVTKQYGLPLPLKDHQFIRFMKLPLVKRLRLLANDINDGKGVERHRLYVNSANTEAKSWADHCYCVKHNVLIKPRHSTKSVAQNSHATVFGRAFSKIYHHAHKKVSRHHYSAYEHWIQARYGNVDLAYRRRDVGVDQMKLF